MHLKSLAGSAFVATLAIATASSAATRNYETTLTDISNLGASGRVSFALDTEANTLGVSIRASGLAPDQIHIAHIHGPVDEMGTPTNAVTPSFGAGADTDGDGFIELAEGLPFYGGILLNLSDDTVPGLAGFSTAPGGEISFDYVYNLLTTPNFTPGNSIDTLLPLYLREVVIHGAFLNAGQGSNGGEADGTAGYKLILPVLSGEIVEVPAPIPLPAAGWALLSGLGGLAALRRLRKRV